jgi:hypothetical protein
MESAGYPVPMTILVVDAESFSLLPNSEQLAARRLLYAVLSESLESAGVPWQYCRHEDRGDGAVVLIPPEIPKPVVLRGLLAGFGDRLAEVTRRHGLPSLRIRAALHAGEVHFDQHGIAGSDLNHAFRLADCPELKQALRLSRVGFALIVSDALYRSTVLHRYDGLDPARFFQVQVRVKEADAIGWLSTPGDEDCAERVAGHPRPVPALARPGDGGLRLQAGRDLSIDGANVAGRDITVSGPATTRESTKRGTRKRRI